MNLTATLFNFLTGSFSPNPAAFVAFTFAYDGGGMTWEVADGFLTTAVSGGPGASLNIDLSQYTITTLVDFIAGQAGYSVSYIDDTANATLGALVLLDGEGGPGNISGYTSLLYSYLEAQSYELEAAQATIAAMPAQLSILNNGAPSAEGFWLDELGQYYGGIGRNSGELDDKYAKRTVASVIEVKCNNVAMELAITQYTNEPTTVTDVATYSGGITYGGAFNYDGSHNYNSAASLQYNLFDVTYNYDFSDGANPTYVLAVVTGIVAAVRAAGCHPRNIALA